ncbi:MAG TPA: STAS domain-containing protein [Planctomycetota bacterium]|nr:STAS domain-containing protein [Planctomycetota bacterium]
MLVNIQIADDKQSAQVRFAGSMDSHTVGEISNAFRDVLEKEIFHILVDMKEVDYLSSACIGVLIQSQTEAQTNGGEIRLRNIQSNVKRTLELMGLYHMMGAEA